MRDEPRQLLVRVLLCGERLRGDDAAALLAADLLPEDARALAEVIEVGPLSVEALLDVPDGVALVVADAAVGVAAGRVVTVPLEQVAAQGGVAGVAGEGGACMAGGAFGGTAARVAPASSHSLPPDQVLALAAELRGSLSRGVFVGIGGADFGLGERLSPLVAAGLAAFAASLADEIRRLAADKP